jgi:hypothetical protein
VTGVKDLFGLAKAISHHTTIKSLEFYMDGSKSKRAMKFSDISEDYYSDDGKVLFVYPFDRNSDRTSIASVDRKGMTMQELAIALRSINSELQSLHFAVIREVAKKYFYTKRSK